MSTIVIQMGHCFRTSGATGTHREQEFASKVGPSFRDELRVRGHNVILIFADDRTDRVCDAFIALHTDGSTNKARRGASVGYPNSRSAKLAHAWKRAHQRAGYVWGFHPDNYTAALGGYYGFGDAIGTYEFLAEHGFTTNAADEKWLFENIDKCVMAHVEAIGEVLGHPKSPASPLPAPEDDMYELLETVDSGKLYAYAPGEMIHIPTTDRFLHMCATGSFPRQTRTDGSVVANDVFQVQVDETVATMRENTVFSR